MFIHLESLRLLELNKNRLVEIPGLTFDGLNKVKVLKLKRNNLRYVTICRTVQRSVKWIQLRTWVGSIPFFPPGSWWTALSMVLIPSKSFILIGTRWDICILKLPFSIWVTAEGSSNIVFKVVTVNKGWLYGLTKLKQLSLAHNQVTATSTKVFSFW